MMYEFSDEWGAHSHEIKGPPYDHKAPVTCASCIVMLDTKLTAWLDVLTERHNLPPNFWDGYKPRSWE